MNETTDQEIDELREEAERTKDDPYPPGEPRRPNRNRAKVLSVRLNPEEFEELARYAETVEVPPSSLVRGWILEQLRAGSESPRTTVDRIAQEIEQLRRQLAA
ncbi:MAG: hypothetical protein ACRDQA_27060 [Nocardioidaceae bacterium]